MNKTHQKTLEAIFRKPVSANLEWRRIESLFKAVGAQTIEGSGSRVRFELMGLLARSIGHTLKKRPSRIKFMMRAHFLKKRGIAMNTMNYKSYSARIEYSDKDDCFVGHIAGINDVVGFHGDSVSELHTAFEEAVDDYLETCKKAKRSPQKPYSGNIMLRVPPELHAKVAMLAEAHGKSLNSWVTEILSSAD